MSTNRIEAFSDGVFAIVITLLVLEIKVPELSGHAVDGELLRALIALWPKFASFIISFVVVGVYWVAHHYAFHHIKHADRSLIWINNLFLLCVVFIPFPTALLGTYIGDRVAVIAYGLTLIVVGLSLGVLWWYGEYHQRTIGQHIDPAMIRHARRLIWTPPFCYVLAIVVAFVYTPAALVIYALIPLLYIVPTPYLRTSG